MRYRVLVELKAERVVTLEAPSAREALARAQRAAFPRRHRRDHIKSFVVSGYPKPSASPPASALESRSRPTDR